MTAPQTPQPLPEPHEVRRRDHYERLVREAAIDQVDELCKFFQVPLRQAAKEDQESKQQ